MRPGSRHAVKKFTQVNICRAHAAEEPPPGCILQPGVAVSRPCGRGAGETGCTMRPVSVAPPVGVGSGRRPGRDAHGLNGGRHRGDEGSQWLAAGY
jgi:hypothetical protein